jgi:hypothetical protein
MKSFAPISMQHSCEEAATQAGRDAASRLMSWNILFAGLIVVGFANGVSHRVITVLSDDGGRAFLNTFDISAIVWIALAVCTLFLLAPPQRMGSKADRVAAYLAIAAFLAPVPQLSWLGLTGLGAYLAASAPPGSLHRRGAWILLAMTVPMFWSRAVFSLMSDVILGFDAVLVSLVLGTARSGNTVAFADGWGYFYVAPACSSLANISLALLCWVLTTQALGTARIARIGYCFLAAGAVVAINVARLTLTGISHANYELVHGPVGSAIAGWTTFAVVFAICLYGATHNANHAAKTHH